MPIGIANIGWRMYMVNGSWDIIVLILIVCGPVSLPVTSRHRLLTIYDRSIQAVFWVETKGKTLEEIDAIFEGHKHSSVPDVELVRRGVATVDVGLVEGVTRAEKPLPPLP